jgi:uncharacterized protein
VVVAWPILLECYSLVLHRLGPATAHRWLASVERGAGRVMPHAEELEQAAQQVRRLADQPITLFDAVLHEMSLRLSVPVWTFDHHFDVMGADVWR